MRKINVLKILKALLKNPRVSDRKIAKMVNVSQPTVTRVRTKLQQTGFLKFMAIPDLNSIGIELVAICRIHLDEFDYEAIRDDPKVIFASGQDDPSTVISVHKNYTDFHIFASSHAIVSTILIPSLTTPIKPFSFAKIDFDELEV